MLCLSLSHAAAFVSTELKSIETTGSLTPALSYEACCPKPQSKCMIACEIDVTILFILCMLLQLAHAIMIIIMGLR